jgi:hypothetical protein
MVAVENVVIMLPLADLKVMYDLKLGRIDIIELPATSVADQYAIPVMMLTFTMPKLVAMATTVAATTVVSACRVGFQACCIANRCTVYVDTG